MPHKSPPTNGPYKKKWVHDRNFQFPPSDSLWLKKWSFGQPLMLPGGSWGWDIWFWRAAASCGGIGSPPEGHSPSKEKSVLGTEQSFGDSRTTTNGVSILIAHSHDRTTKRICRKRAVGKIKMELKTQRLMEYRMKKNLLGIFMHVPRLPIHWRNNQTGLNLLARNRVWSFWAILFNIHSPTHVHIQT